jgi:hypothetical protein
MNSKAKLLQCATWGDRTQSPFGSEKLGLENDVKPIIVKDREIGRWQQWKKVANGECAACFVAPIYLPAALDAGLKTFFLCLKPRLSATSHKRAFQASPQRMLHS